ncbi:ATP synthase subunit a [Pilimelia terevasa]|uniref:ATP synthase subunit a n=1 Tax=Pilimelia terevasa TaxID=53372 RepID=A0A8J3BJJ3_9ACTN|nr:F0F1 ATP synthase subunit A [Pilimelia terevasa]GGK18920.1 ATP synthase subunit a [Pilimelia terevasa]
MFAQLTTDPGESGFHAPKVGDFFPGPIVEGAPGWLTKYTILVAIAVVAILAFFLLAYRDPKLVPTKKQWFAESIYGFARNSISQGMIGPEGVRFAPYITTLFVFIAAMNFFAILPGVQTSPNSHIAYPLVLGLLSYFIFIAVGIKKHGAGRFFKNHLMPPAPWFMQPLLIPIEFISNFIARPLTLALRLFANMFAGHMILVVFTMGGFALLGAQNILLKPIGILSFLMAIALTFLEMLVVILQAYIFSVLSASYIGGALADEH